MTHFLSNELHRSSNINFTKCIGDHFRERRLIRCSQNIVSCVTDFIADLPTCLLTHHLHILNGENYPEN